MGEMTHNIYLFPEITFLSPNVEVFDELGKKSKTCEFA